MPVLVLYVLLGFIAALIKDIVAETYAKTKVLIIVVHEINLPTKTNLGLCVEKKDEEKPQQVLRELP